MLNIQQWLFDNNGDLNKLKSTFNINYNIYDNLDLVILNYDQLNSDKNLDIVQECRGLILQLNTWNIVAYPFRRFFNYTEQNNNTSFNFSSAIALEKLDGSMITVFYWNDQWIIATRNSIGGLNNNSHNYNYLDLFNKSKPEDLYDNLNKNWSYVFELTAPENKIITPYIDKKITLILIRDDKHHELPFNVIQQTCVDLNISIPKVYNFNDFNELKHIISQFDITDEGLVCVDYSFYCSDNMSFKRVKVKNPAYLAITNINSNGNVNIQNFIRLVLCGDSDEFLTYYPQHKNIIDMIKIKYQNWVSLFEKELNSIKPYFNTDGKYFADIVRNYTFKKVLFDIKSNKIQNLDQHIEYMINNKEKTFLKQLVIEWNLDNI